MYKRLKNRKGFTLTELMIITAIVGIMASITVPNIIGWMPKYRLKTATRDVYSTLQLARMRAVAREFEYQVSFDLSNETYSISKGNSSSGSTSWTQEGVVSTVPDEIDIVSLSGGLTNLHFHPTGSSSNATTITISNSKGDEKKITVLTATGRIKIL
jgi:prepilin-type N-terminal cleavage/methylation domain-containing protein